MNRSTIVTCGFVLAIGACAFAPSVLSHQINDGGQGVPAKDNQAERDRLERKFAELSAKRAKSMTLPELQQAVEQDLDRELNRATEILRNLAANHPKTPVGRKAKRALDVLDKNDSEGSAWQAFSEEKLQQLLGEKKSVLISFSAEWCLLCKRNERVALTTSETSTLLAEHDIVPLRADYTDSDEDVSKYLKQFNSISVPLTVIIPNGEIEKARVLRDAITQAALTDSIKETVGQAK